VAGLNARKRGIEKSVPNGIEETPITLKPITCRKKLKLQHQTIVFVTPPGQRIGKLACPSAG